MEHRFRSRILAPGIASLLGLALLISPWSPSTQTRGSFSLALDLDDAEGDQAVSSLDVSPGQAVPIQIFGSDIQGVSSLSVRFEYDSTQVVYEGFDAGDVLPDAQALVEQDSTSVRIDVTSLSGSTVNTGLVGTARFRTTDAFLETEIRLVRAQLARGGLSEVSTPALGVALQLAAPPSPDFDGNGRVDFADFVLFAGAFGYREGQAPYEAKYDLNGDGGIAFDDFVIFATSFGEAVNRALVFTSTVTRSVSENSPAGEPIGDPITAADADGNPLSYSLRGADADSFAIDAGTGQLRTREGIAYDHEAKNRYSVAVRASDGEGGRADLVVRIAVTDADEPPSTPPSGVVVAPGDSALTVRWDAAHDEAGKPPVSGYEVAHLPAAQDSAQAGRPEDTGDWEEGRILNSRTDTSVTLTRLNNEQTYQVRVRTLNDEGASQWSTPVSGAPTAGSVTVPASNEPSLAVPWLYWTDARTGRIQRAELDGSDIRTLVSGLGQPRDLALDRDGGRMYWTDSGSDKIRRANLDGSRVEDLVTEGLKEPFGIALDVAGGKMYWTDYGTDKIQRANLDGSGVEDLVTTGLNEPYGLALDVAGGKMYWTDYGTDKIQRANLDGSGVEDLVTGLNQPRGIALDLGDGRMYWPDWGTDKIQRANLDGSGAEDLVTAGLQTPQAIALDAGGGKMYWTDYGTDKIQRANLDGSGVEDLVTSGLNEPYGLALGAGLPAQIFKAGGDSATLNLAGRFRDPDGGAVTLSVSSSDEAVATAALADSQVTIAPVAPGQITVAVTARDEGGRAATLLVPVTVYPPNRPPVVAQAPADRKVRIDSLARVELSEAFTDPDVGDVLTYTATSSDEAVATAAVEGSGVNIAPKSPGQARISVTARDPEGLEASLSFGVTVEPKPPPPPPPPPPRPPPRPRPPPPRPPPPRPPPAPNQAPVFNEGASTNRSVAENTPGGQDIGDPIRATDPEGRAVSYSLTGGDTDQFTIASSNGQLRTQTGVDYNYEARNRYPVTVEAQDEQGGRATIAVTIDVTDDDNEPPDKPDPPTVTASTLTSLSVRWTEPANPGPPITDYNVQYREGSSGAFTTVAHDGTGTTTTIANLESDTAYQIQVQAISDEGTSEWSDSGNGTTLTGPSPTITILRGPYLQSGTSSSVIIKWRTDEATESVVHYGLDPNSLTLSASNATSTTEHAVQLTGLSADVKYFYSVGTSSVTLAGGDRDHFVVTAPVPGTAKPTRIWVIGDSGTANRNARAVRDAFLNFTESRDPDLWIMLGDNAYDDGTDNEYRKAVFNTYPQVLPRTVLWPTLGNHDGRTADSTTESGPYYEIFSLPRNGEAGGVASGTEAYYSFDYGNMHFICLDSKKTDRSADGAMMTWLEADLAANDREWVIAFWHHPPYSKGSADSDEQWGSILLRQNAVPILERYGVDLVLTGHSHAYERSYLIDGHYGLSDTFTDAMEKNPGDGSATGDGAYQKPAAVGAPHAGAVYVVAGTAGLVKPGGSLDHPAMAVSIRTLGSMVLDVNGSRLDAMFLDSTGNIRDDFTILKVPDTISPQISSVQAQGTPTQAVVTFSEYVEQASAETASNYAIDNGVTVSAAGLGDDGRTVTLTTAPLTQGITYTLTVNNVVDLAGNPIATDSQEQFQYNNITGSIQDGVAPTAGYAGTTDTYMSSNAPTSNFGSSAMLLLDGDDPGGSGNDLASLLKWDISSIPPGSFVDSAQITLDVFNSTTGVYEIYELKSNWVEAEASWNVFAVGSGWQTPGAQGPLDRGSLVLGTISPAFSGSYSISLNAKGLALVQSWIDDPATNNGIIIANSSTTGGLDVRSRKYGTAAQRPKLTVTYSPPVTDTESPRRRR